MTRYLQTLIAQARGAASEVKPRIRSRFEPDDAASPEILAENVGYSARIEQPSAPIRTTPTAPPAPPDQFWHATTRPDLTPGVDREILRQIHEHTDRVERIEHRVTEREVQRSTPFAAPERAVILHRQAQSAAPARSAVATDLRTATPPPHPTAPEPLPPRRPASTAPAEPSLRSEDAPAATNPPPPRTQTPAPIPTRREPADRFDAPAPAEITITIGVLDIRLTQDAPADRRPSPRAPDRPATTLPLADYLAKRSGATP